MPLGNRRARQRPTHRSSDGSTLARRANRQLAMATTRCATGVAVLVAAHRMPRWGALEAEIRMRLPGDEVVVPGSLPTVTTVVTIAAAPEAVWPWVVQIGRGRAGFYICTWSGNALGAHIRLLSEHCVAPPRGLPARMAATFWSPTPMLRWPFGGRDASDIDCPPHPPAPDDAGPFRPRHSAGTLHPSIGRIP